MKQIYAILIVSCLLVNSAKGQQLLFIQGDGTGSDTQPELYVEGGSTGILYVEGGVTVTGIAPRLINSGAIVVDGGNWENISNADVDVSSPSNTYNNILGFTDLGTNYTADDLYGGTVHFITGDQEINGNFGTTFYNLSLDGLSVNTKQLNGVDVEINHQLFLNDEFFDLNNNTLFISNPSVGAISRASSGSAGNEPTNPYGNPSLGMGSMNQFGNTISGMITATNQGRLKRVTSAGEGPYFFPLGSSDHLIYRPMEIIISNQNTSYSARLEKNTPNPLSFGIPAPTAVNTNFYHLVNCEAGNTNDEMRIYGSLIDLTQASEDCNPITSLQNFGIAQTSEVAYSKWIFESGMGAGTGNGDLYFVHTIQYATDAAGYISNVNDFREAYVIAFKKLLGFKK